MSFYRGRLGCGVLMFYQYVAAMRLMAQTLGIEHFSRCNSVPSSVFSVLQICTFDFVISHGNKHINTLAP